jgi:hypothetical protein
MSRLHMGIFGRSLSGKTTLAKAISRAMFEIGGEVETPDGVEFRQFETIVFDVNGDDWGPHATVCTSKADFWAEVWKRESCFVICDDASETINREKDLTPLFTRLRHRGHKLCVCGHDGTDLLPKMRRQLTTVCFFWQPPEALKIWYRDFADRRIFAASALNSDAFEFLRITLNGPAAKERLVS